MYVEKAFAMGIGGKSIGCKPGGKRETEKGEGMEEEGGGGEGRVK